jgi:hypothetical protein
MRRSDSERPDSGLTWYGLENGHDPPGASIRWRCCWTRFEQAHERIDTKPVAQELLHRQLGTDAARRGHEGPA